MISFIVPAYNEETELPATLRALHSAGAGHEYEIVLVDDGSTDATSAIGQQFGARVIAIERRQIAAARNAGARAANGDVFIFVDADTRIGPEHVRGALTALSNGFAGGGCRLVFDGEIPLWGKVLSRVLSELYFGLNLGAGAFLFTTGENFFAAGGFDEIYFAGEEVFFSIALKQLGKFTLLREPAITSGRKLRMYSGWKIFRRLLSVLVGGPRGVMSRKNLDLWYGGEREVAAGKELV
jgi:glycosyltransferase involved in cell wall biosynthesis